MNIKETNRKIEKVEAKDIKMKKEIEYIIEMEVKSKVFLSKEIVNKFFSRKHWKNIKHNIIE